MSTTASAPGSVTIVFAPQNDAASLGVSFATADGATATVEAASETTVQLDGTPTSIAPVTGVLDRLGVAAAVRIGAEVPIGCGFGVSGAAALATALAANEAFALGHNREALVEVAHRAEVAAGTGLGDVFVQNRGGLVWDRGEGLEQASRTGRIEYTTFGSISTAEVLGEEERMERVGTAGRNVLASIDPRGELAALFDASWGFAVDAGLATERIAEAVADVRAAGGAATMAMIGQTVIATGVDGVLECETRLTSAGATLQ